MVTDRKRESAGTVEWRQADGLPVSCTEKLKVLNENLGEIRQLCQDAFDDATRMGCDETHVRAVLAAVIAGLHSPYGPK